MIMFLSMSTGYWIIALSGNRNVYLFFSKRQNCFYLYQIINIISSSHRYFILNNHVSFFMTELLLLL